MRLRAELEQHYPGEGEVRLQHTISRFKAIFPATDTSSSIVRITMGRLITSRAAGFTRLTTRIAFRASETLLAVPTTSGRRRSKHD